MWGPRAQQVTAEEIRGTHRATDQRRTAWAALDGSGRVVGAAVLIEPLRENRDTAGVWLSVQPECWRQGVGSLLLSHAEATAAAAGRSRIHEHNGEPHEVPGPGTLFARRHGYRQVLLDLRSDLALPLATDRLEALADEAHDPAYALETAWDEMPEGWLEDRALLARRMSTDAPTGGIDLEEEDWDAGRLATGGPGAAPTRGGRWRRWRGTSRPVAWSATPTSRSHRARPTWPSRATPSSCGSTAATGSASRSRWPTSGPCRRPSRTSPPCAPGTPTRTRRCWPSTGGWGSSPPA